MGERLVGLATLRGDLGEDLTLRALNILGSIVFLGGDIEFRRKLKSEVVTVLRLELRRSEVMELLGIVRLELRLSLETESLLWSLRTGESEFLRFSDAFLPFAASVSGFSDGELSALNTLSTPFCLLVGL